MGSRVVTADGVEIAIVPLGPQGGPAVVMAHATGFCAEVLRPVAAQMAPVYWPVGFDARGHGGSGAPPERITGWQRWDWHGFGLDVLAVVDWMDRWPDASGMSEAGGVTGMRGETVQAGEPAPYGFGHSMGGASLLLAEIARPGTFAGIYAFEPVVFRPPPSDVLDQSSPLAEMTRRRREVFGSAPDAYTNFAHKGPFAAFDPASLAAYLQCGFEEGTDGSVRLACRREHEAFIYEAGLAHDAWSHLGELSCPVTVAYGERSEFIGEADALALASRIPSGRVELIEGVGHFGPMERPGAVAESMEAAFGAVRASDTPLT